MRTHTRLIVAGITFVTAIATVAALSGSASAQEKEEKQERTKWSMPQNPSGKISAWEAMSSVEKSSGGHAFQAVFEFEDGHWIYGVFVLKGHKISEVEVDATTGKIGDSEDVTPAGEAKEVQEELKRVQESGK